MGSKAGTDPAAVAFDAVDAATTPGCGAQGGSGGAEAMTLMGQRIISTSAVQCVGNTVILHGQVFDERGRPANRPVGAAGDRRPSKIYPV